MRVFEGSLGFATRIPRQAKKMCTSFDGTRRKLLHESPGSSFQLAHRIVWTSVASGEELDDLHVEARCDFRKHVKGGVCLTALDAADVGIVHADHVGELTQGEALFLSEPIDCGADQTPVLQALRIHFLSVCDSMMWQLGYETTTRI